MYNSYESPTTLNISERWERVLCYAFLWVGGLVMFIIERRNSNVRRHAAQSMLVFGSLSILLWVFSSLGWLFGHIPLLGWLFVAGFGAVHGIIFTVGVILFVLLIVMALLTPNFFLPLGRTYHRLIGN
ncbi:MAG TPA: hypothetical protein VIG30_01170 [Ktedonobacterales bacterium]|jgi:uncharacterized membrane protein